MLRCRNRLPAFTKGIDSKVVSCIEAVFLR
jgi:hypothetical protein